MGLLLPETAAVSQNINTNTRLLHQMECRACPLNKQSHHGKQEPSGAEDPLIYVLGEAPGATDEDVFQLFEPLIPRKYQERIRFNNVIRSQPPIIRAPVFTEIECCRPSIVRDIERSKPRAIFGFGNVPLTWISSFSGIPMWRGRRMPVKVGSHHCWYYPLTHPSEILQGRRNSEDGFVFKMDVRRAFDEVEFLPPARVHSVADAKRDVVIVTGTEKEILEQMEAALAWAKVQKVPGVDYETNGLRPYIAGAKILTAAVGTLEKSYAFPFDHREQHWSPDGRKRRDELWVDFLENAEGIKAVHNLSFEMEWTGWFYGRHLLRKGRWGDSSTQAAILDERKGKQRPGPFSLEFLIQQYFGFNLKSISNLDRKNLDDVQLELVLLYNGMDSKYHSGLYVEQFKELRDIGLLEPYRLSLRKVPTVVLSQLKGVPVDQEEVESLVTKYTDRLEGIEEEIAALPIIKRFKQLKGLDFNALSNPDVIYVFGDLLKREEINVVDKYSKKDKKSADEKILAKIDHPLAPLVIKLRKANKLKSTYIDPLRQGSDILYPDGLLHPQFNTIFAETGRLSADSPNVQNFPKRGDEAKEVRKPIKAPPKHKIVSFDYGQIEARVIAMFTKDPVFVKSLWDRYDVHMEWAERIAAAYPKRIGGKEFLKDKKAMKAFRGDIKNQWTFPLFFGAKMESAAGYLEIPEDVIAPLYDEFWDQFAPTKVWQDQLMKFYRANGYVECLTGRRRRAPMTLNMVINSPVQGTAAEIVMDGMSRLSETGDWELQPEINIHDDLTWLRMPENKVADCAEKIITAMLDVPFPWVNVPITVEMSIGDDWMNMKEYDTFASDTWFK